MPLYFVFTLYALIWTTMVKSHPSENGVLIQTSNTIEEPTYTVTIHELCCTSMQHLLLDFLLFLILHVLCN